MAFQWMRRALIGLASAVLLSACGSGTIESQLTPSRVILFGDAFTDAGQSGARYTVNDGSRTWAEVVGTHYGVSVTPAASGGTGYATGNVRIVRTDTSGDTATPTIQQQIDTFLASNSLGANDLVLINGGFSDIISEMALVTANTQSSSQMLNNVNQAALDFAAQAKRLVAAGGKHIVLVGTYDLGKTPWAASINQQSLLSSASSSFNQTLLIALVDQGANMLYVDAELAFNQMVNSPASYSLDNVIAPVCTSVDPGAGIGIGANQVNSKLCTTSTLVAGVDYTRSLFADAVYPTPAGHARFGDFAFSRVHSRW
jgi:outer membrane lipase/esterase